MESDSAAGIINFAVEKSTTVARRIFDHHVDIINWHLALLDDQNSVTVLDRDLKQITVLDKVHEDKINQIKCLKEHVVTCSDDKTIKFFNKASGKLDLTLNCKALKDSTHFDSSQASHVFFYQRGDTRSRARGGRHCSLVRTPPYFLAI